jgi:hypothetical protein
MLATVSASNRQNDDDVVIAKGNGVPCFSYPQDNEM